MSSRLRTRPLFLVWRVGIILGKANVIGEEVAQVCAPKARTMLNRFHHVSAAVIHQQALWSRRNVDNVNGVLSGRSGQIGRASCRDRVCQSEWIPMVAV